MRARKGRGGRARGAGGVRKEGGGRERRRGEREREKEDSRGYFVSILTWSHRRGEIMRKMSIHYFLDLRKTRVKNTGKYFPGFIRIFPGKYRKVK